MAYLLHVSAETIWVLPNIDDVFHSSSDGVPQTFPFCRAIGEETDTLFGRHFQHGLYIDRSSQNVHQFDTQTGSPIIDEYLLQQFGLTRDDVSVINGSLLGKMPYAVNLGSILSPDYRLPLPHHATSVTEIDGVLGSIYLLRGAYLLYVTKSSFQSRVFGHEVRDVSRVEMQSFNGEDPQDDLSRSYYMSDEESMNMNAVLNVFDEFTVPQSSSSNNDSKNDRYSLQPAPGAFLCYSRSLDLTLHTQKQVDYMHLSSQNTLHTQKLSYCEVASDQISRTNEMHCITRPHLSSLLYNYARSFRTCLTSIWDQYCMHKEWSLADVRAAVARQEEYRLNPLKPLTSEEQQFVLPLIPPKPPTPSVNSPCALAAMIIVPIVGSVVSTKYQDYIMHTVTRVHRHRIGPNTFTRGMDAGGRSAGADVEHILEQWNKDKLIRTWSFVSSRGSALVEYTCPVSMGMLQDAHVQLQPQQPAYETTKMGVDRILGVFFPINYHTKAHTKPLLHFLDSSENVELGNELDKALACVNKQYSKNSDKNKNTNDDNDDNNASVIKYTRVTSQLNSTQLDKLVTIVKDAGFTQIDFVHSSDDNDDSRASWSKLKFGERRPGKPTVLSAQGTILRINSVNCCDRASALQTALHALTLPSMVSNPTILSYAFGSLYYAATHQNHMYSRIITGTASLSDYHLDKLCQFLKIDLSQNTHCSVLGVKPLFVEADNTGVYTSPGSERHESVASLLKPPQEHVPVSGVLLSMLPTRVMRRWYQTGQQSTKLDWYLTFTTFYKPTRGVLPRQGMEIVARTETVNGQEQTYYKLQPMQGIDKHMRCWTIWLLSLLTVIFTLAMCWILFPYFPIAPSSDDLLTYPLTAPTLSYTYFAALAFQLLLTPAASTPAAVQSCLLQQSQQFISKVETNVYLWGTRLHEDHPQIPLLSPDDLQNLVMSPLLPVQIADLTSTGHSSDFVKLDTYQGNQIIVPSIALKSLDMLHNVRKYSALVEQAQNSNQIDFQSIDALRALAPTCGIDALFSDDSTTESLLVRATAQTYTFNILNFHPLIMAGLGLFLLFTSAVILTLIFESQLIQKPTILPQYLNSPYDFGPPLYTQKQLNKKQSII